LCTKHAECRKKRYRCLWIIYRKVSEIYVYKTNLDVVLLAAAPVDDVDYDRAAR